MKYSLWILGLFAAAVALTTAAHNSAYVQLVYPPYRIEISFTLFITSLLLMSVLGYGLVRLILAVQSLPTQVRKFRLARAQARARKLLDEALSAYFESRYAAAEKAATRAMEMAQASSFHSIIAARSAHKLGEFKKRDAYLSSSKDKNIGESTMRLITTAKFMLDQHDSSAALDVLQELHDSGVKSHIGALSLELKAQQQVGNWDDVLRVLDQMEKRASIDAAAAAKFRQEAWLGKIRMQGNLDGLTACLKKIPSDIKKYNKIVAATARALMQHGGCDLAQQLLSDSLNAQWDGKLVALYGDCQSSDLLAQIEQAEKWLNQHKQEARLLLALGKLCMHQSLWGKAQSYLEASASLSPGHAVYDALGQLAERMGKSGDASRHYQQAMNMAARLRIGD
ncbi:MAG: heme biosynthesis HemY N-terminal domain-containing protein [Gallionella sp.]